MTRRVLPLSPPLLLACNGGGDQPGAARGPEPAWSAAVGGGAENNGLRTPKIMEGACYAWLLFHDDREQHFVRRLARGLSSWRLAMQRNATDPEIGLDSRAAYPISVHDVDRDVDIDYDP